MQRYFPMKIGKRKRPFKYRACIYEIPIVVLRNAMALVRAISSTSAVLTEKLFHLHLDKMAAILRTKVSDAFSWMESFVFWLKLCVYITKSACCIYITVRFIVGIILWLTACSRLTHSSIWRLQGHLEHSVSKTCIYINVYTLLNYPVTIYSGPELSLLKKLIKTPYTADCIIWNGIYFCWSKPPVFHNFSCDFYQ